MELYCDSYRNTGQALDGHDLGKDWPAKWRAILQGSYRSEQLTDKPHQPRCATPSPDPEMLMEFNEKNEKVLSVWHPDFRLPDEDSSSAPASSSPSFGLCHLRFVLAYSFFVRWTW